jgi:hypothetical protein
LRQGRESFAGGTQTIQELTQRWNENEIADIPLRGHGTDAGCWHTGGRTTGASGFVIYDRTTYTQKPDLAPFGIKPITIVYSGPLWKNAENRLGMPDPNVIRALAVAAAATTGIASIDNESWRVAGVTAPGGIRKYQEMIRLFKQSAPTLRVGYFGFPLRNSTAAMLGSDSFQYKSWQAVNDDLRPIAQLSDVLVPLPIRLVGIRRTGRIP